MPSTIQDILHRIEKLKTSLQEKNAMLEERDRALGELRDRVAEAGGRALEYEREIEALKIRLATASPVKSEAFAAAERVETITNLQMNLQRHIEENRALKAKLRPPTRPGFDTDTPRPADETARELDEARRKDLEQTREIVALRAENEDLRSQLAGFEQQALAGQGAPAEERPEERPNERPSDSGEFRSEEVISAQQAQIAELTSELEERDQVASTQMAQIGELEEAAAVLRRNMAGVERRLAALEADVAEKDQVVSELMMQLSDAVE